MFRRLLATLALAATATFSLVAPAHAAAPTFSNASSEATLSSGWSTAAIRVGTDGLSKVIVRGTGLTGATVQVDGVEVTPVEIVSDTEIGFIAPAGVHNTEVDLVVTTPDGTFTKSSWLKYYTRPVNLTPPVLSGIAAPGETLTLTPATYEVGTWNGGSSSWIGCEEPFSQVQTLTLAGGCDKTFTQTTSTSLELNDSHLCRHISFRDNRNLAGVYNYQTSKSTDMVLPQSAPWATCYFANGALASVPAVGSSDNPVAAGRNSLFITGREFVGWNTAPGGNGDFYAEGDALPTDGNLLLYAQFAEREIFQAAEINPGSGHSSIYDIAELGGKLYLNATHPATGRELFVYDGQSVELVADLNPGPANGLYDMRFIASTGSEIYFQATDGTVGYELYKFDGTDLTLVADMNPAVAASADFFDQRAAGGLPGNDGRAIYFGNKIFFEAAYPSNMGYVLDPAGPGLPVAFGDYFTNVPVAGFRAPFALGGKLYFIAGSGSSTTIFYTDGTADPVAVADTAGTYPTLMGGIGAQVLYAGSPLTYGDPNKDRFDIELYRFDGNNPGNGVTFVAELNANVASNGNPQPSYPSQFNVYNSKLYFTATTTDGDKELLSWDGANVALAKDFYPGAGTTLRGNPTGMTTIGSEMFLSAQTDGTGSELWIWSGSDATMVEDAMPGTTGAFSGTPRFLEFGGDVYFSMQKPGTGLELFAFGVPPVGHFVASYDHQYSITFDANGGSGTNTAQHSAGTISLPTGSEFSLMGKVLAGWDADSLASDPTYQPGANLSVTQDLVLYAIWADPVTYTITFDPNGGTGSASLTAEAGVVVLEDGSGFLSGTATLLGWDENSTATNPTYSLGANFSLSQDVTLFAIWADPVTHTITYDPNGGTGSASSTSQAGDVTLDDGSGFSNGDATLLGWDIDASSTSPTYALGANFSLSQDVTLFAIWQQPEVDNPTPPSAINPEMPVVRFPSGPAQAPAGGDLELRGDNLESVTKAEIDVENAPITSQSSTSLTLEVPELDNGLYNLTLFSVSGKFVIQDAVSVTGKVTSITDDAKSKIAAWTKLGSTGKSVTFYAKDPIGLGKLQFFVDGEEIAWINAVDESDPKLSFASGNPYLVRSVELNPGKNRFEIKLDGVRVWRATYVPKG